MSVDNLPVLDAPALLERLGDDEECFKEVIQIFLDECPHILERAQTAINEKNTDVIAKVGHEMKGMCANMDAQQMRHWAYELECLGKTGSIETLNDTWQSLLVSFETLKQHVQLKGWT